MQVPHVQQVLSPGVWDGLPAFVIGGGPSLRGVDLSPGALGLCPTVGANWAWQHGPDVNFITDFRVLELAMIDPAWQCGTTISLLHAGAAANPLAARVDKDTPASDPAKIALRKSYQVPVTNRRRWGKDFEEGITAAGNSGVMAANIASVLGSNPIFLLGFDLYGDGPAAANWHTAYPDEWSHKAQIYDRFIDQWESAKVGIDEAGIRIFNCNPKSRLECFPKLDGIDEALAMAEELKNAN